MAVKRDSRKALVAQVHTQNMPSCYLHKVMHHCRQCAFQTAHHKFYVSDILLPYSSDDKGEATSETCLWLRPAGQSVRRKVWQQSAAAGGRWKGAAPHRPQHCRQELQQEEHLQPAQVKLQLCVGTWLNDLLLEHSRLSVEKWWSILYRNTCHIMSLQNLEKLFIHDDSQVISCSPSH